MTYSLAVLRAILRADAARARPKTIDPSPAATPDPADAILSRFDALLGVAAETDDRCVKHRIRRAADRSESQSSDEGDRRSAGRAVRSGTAAARNVASM